ncbi:MAG: zinc ribbon domain-containing protein [Candidatus Bathyarchaeia archaeon]
MRARFLLLALILSLSGSCLLVPVYAQTVSVSNLQYSSTSILGKQVTVSFTVNYQGATVGYLLLAAVWDVAANTFASGSAVSSDPVGCQQAPASYSLTAGCGYVLSNLQGSDVVSFALRIASVGTYRFSAVAVLEDAQSKVLAFTPYSDNEFSISIVDKFTLTVSTPSQVSVTVDGVQEGTGFTSLKLLPGSHAISVPAMVQVDNSTRLRFDHWEDGSTDMTRTLDLQDDTTLTANYITQYRLNLVSQGNATGSGWYDSGTIASFSVPSRSQVIWVFQGWYEVGSLVTSSNNGSITMDAPHTLVARWGLDYILLVGVIGVLVGIAVGLAYFGKKLPFLAKPSRKRARRKQAKRTQAFSEPIIEDTAVSKTATQETVKPSADEKAAMFCTQCGAKILRDSKFCKECGAKLQ